MAGKALSAPLKVIDALYDRVESLLDLVSVSSPIMRFVPFSPWTRAPRKAGALMTGEPGSKASPDHPATGDHRNKSICLMSQNSLKYSVPVIFHVTLLGGIKIMRAHTVATRHQE